MKLINEKGRLFGLINPLDLIIVLFVAAAAVFAVMYLRLGGFRGGEKVTVYYTVEIAGQKKALGFDKLVKVGDEVKDSVKGFHIGYVDKVEVKDSISINVDKANEGYIEQVIEDETVILVTVKCVGYETDSAITAENVEVRIGKQMFIEGKGWVMTGYIVGLRTEPGGI